MRIYRFEVNSLIPNSENRCTSNYTVTTKVFSDEEVNNNVVFNYINTLNEQKLAGIIENYSYREVNLSASSNTMNKIIDYMSFEDFKKMMLLIPKEEKEQEIRDKKEYSPWC